MVKILNQKGELVQTISTKENPHYFIEKGKKPYQVEYQVLKFEEAMPVFDYLGYSQKEVAEVLEVNASTLSRWNKNKKDNPMGKLQSKIVNQIDEIIAKGVALFGSQETFKQWLETPNFGLGGQKPLDMLKDPYALEKVEESLEAMSWGNVF
jgi:putative toxin-antitoxin system antitoxin component (TIGR02293 family)